MNRVPLEEPLTEGSCGLPARARGIYQRMQLVGRFLRDLPSAQPRPCLAWRGEDGGMQARLLREGLVLGRADDCGIQLKDPRVSRHHARVEPASPGWMLIDLGSSHGTIVNGKAIHARLLRDGDVVQLASQPLVFFGE